jgi:SAM-dependent methyltransferase
VVLPGTRPACDHAGALQAYDVIGHGYAATRRADPRIEAVIRRALGDARTVVNVGAGAGSYEPRDRQVTAVEPSDVMIAQRPPGSAPVVRAAAEALPFPDKSFDAALALLTIHHWTDPQAGLAELVRVADRALVLTWDQAVTERFWLLAEYVPEIAELDAGRHVPVDAVADALGGADVIPVPIPFDCDDGFLGAFWRRPHAYLVPAVRDGISGFAALGDRPLPGLRRLRDDLDSGAWQRRHARLLELDELDVGYRLVVTSEPGEKPAAATAARIGSSAATAGS